MISSAVLAGFERVLHERAHAKDGSFQRPHLWKALRATGADVAGEFGDDDSAHTVHVQFSAFPLMYWACSRCKRRGRGDVTMCAHAWGLFALCVGGHPIGGKVTRADLLLGFNNFQEQAESDSQDPSRTRFRAVLLGGEMNLLVTARPVREPRNTIALYVTNAWADTEVPPIVLELRAVRGDLWAPLQRWFVRPTKGEPSSLVGFVGGTVFRDYDELEVYGSLVSSGGLADRVDVEMELVLSDNPSAPDGAEVR